jgi:predicted NUDIX family NTP pyrophosphohydrolase
MTKRISAGLLLYRVRAGGAPQFFLVHPGGPFWARKDAGAWSIPKGEIESDEDALAAARREFAEETGFVVDGAFRELTALKQPSGKLVRAWALEQDCDPAALRSNLCEIEWPPRSGRRQLVPEVDRAGWFGEAEALEKIQTGQAGFIRQLAAWLASRP